jgi:hypothetical protein
VLALRQHAEADQRLAQRGRVAGRVHERQARRDLASLATVGTRLPPGPLAADAHRLACLDRFGLEQPAGDLDALHRAVPPTVADACLLLADLAACGPPSPAPAGPPR